MKREDLGGGFYVYTDEVNKISTDSVLLSDFADIADDACDLCSGCGIVALRLAKKGVKHVAAVEIDKAAAELIELSAKESNADITVECADVKEFAKREENLGRFPLVTANPPYFKESRSPDRRRNEIRSELLLNPDELFAAANALLCDNGAFCFCHVADRYDELKKSLDKAGLYIQREEFIRSKPEKKPYLVLIEARRQRK